MDTPPADELLRKIQELEAGHAHLKQEMSKLMHSSSDDDKSEHPRPHRYQRSHSISPQRSRFATPRRRGGAGGGGFDGWASCKKGPASFRHSSPLQRESRSLDPSNAEASGAGGVCRGPSAVNFTDKQYLNILQSMGQSVHIFDLYGRIIYWWVVQSSLGFENFDASFAE